MFELSIIFIMSMVILVVALSLLHLGKTSSSPPPSPSAFAAINFIPTQMYLDNAGGHGIALNESTKTVCLIQSTALPPQLIQFTDLIASYVVKNNAITHKTLRTHPKELAVMAKESQGNLLAVAEHLPTSTSPGDQTQKIDLYLVIQNQDNPLYLINFLDMDTKEEGIIFNKAMASTKHWHHLISDLIHQANGQANGKDKHADIAHKNQTDTQPPKPTVNDDLTKPNSLPDNNGHLSI